MNKVTIEPFKVIGISVKTTNENNKAAKDIAGLWGKFINDKILEAIPNKIDNTVIPYTQIMKVITQSRTRQFWVAALRILRTLPKE